MSKQTSNEIVPEGETLPVAQPINNGNFLPNTQLQAVSLMELLKDAGLYGPQIPADQLIDHRFTIRAAKQFQSSFKEGEHAYFVTAFDTETGEVFTTVLGGKAVVDMIDLLAQSNFQAPVIVTLRWQEGKGKFKGYYTLE